MRETNAMQWTGDNWEQLIVFVGDAGTVGPPDEHSLTTAEIVTLDGVVVANPGDRIMRGDGGRLTVERTR